MVQLSLVLGSSVPDKWLRKVKVEKAGEELEEDRMS